MNENTPALPAPSSPPPPSAPNGSNNGNGISNGPGSAGRYTAENLLRTRPRTYHKVKQLLADPDWSLDAISKSCRVHFNSVKAIQMREALAIEERKKELSVMMADVATLGAEGMMVGIQKAHFHHKTIATGVAIDKLLALTGQLPAVQVAVIMPSETERVERRQMDQKLDALMARLNAPPAQADDITTQ